MQHILIYRETLNKILDELPEEKIVELINFAVFISRQPKSGYYKPSVKAVPAAQLQKLTGAVAWGGDALDDTERLYE